MKDHFLKRNVVAILLVAISVIVVAFSSSIIVQAKEASMNVVGKLYEFDDKNDYEYSSYIETEYITESSQFGIFTIDGDIKSISDVNGFDAYEVKDGVVKLTYALRENLIDATETDWHLVEDKSTKVDGEKLDEKILNGVIILQTSLDGVNWVTDITKTDIAGEKSEFDYNLYETKAIQQVNGCYYRIIVAYEIERRLVDTKIGFISKKNYEYKKTAEVYEFYLIDSLDNLSGVTLPNATPRKELGQRINTGKDNGFSGNESITDKDPHFGWNIGTFYLNGYTEVIDGNEEPIFLKTVGDRATLWFHLEEDINCLRGKDNLSINEDKNGYDQYFGIERTNFRHGALIIQFTDYEGKRHDPIIYTDYLAANAKTGADTKVELFEEGDYEVALDYEIKDSSGLNSYTNYRIFFRFKIRNGNCMVYPFDVNTGNELSDNVLAENGFRLDLAKSRYLKINIVKSTVKKEKDRYSLDIRENTATQDGKAYTTEGIYTFTVKNLSTGASTTKTIYVGKSAVYKALANPDIRTIEKLNEKLSQGGELQEDGSILMPVSEEPEKVAEEVEIDIQKVSDTESKELNENPVENEKPSKNIVEIEDEQTVDETINKQAVILQDSTFIFVILGIGFVLILLLIVRKKRGNGRVVENNSERG